MRQSFTCCWPISHLWPTRVPSTSVDNPAAPTQPERSGPRLCRRCQNGGSDIKVEDSRSLAEISRNTHCLICLAVVSWVDTRRAASSHLAVWPASRVFVQYGGDYFLDSGDYREPYPNRSDNSDPTQTIVRCIMSLHVRFIVEDSLEGWAERRSHLIASEFKITPQVSLRYLEDPPLGLVGVEPWEVPSFDVSLLRSWLQGCAKVHKGLCFERAPQQAVAERSLPEEFRVIDVQSMNILKMPGPLRYVALSYMWQQEGPDDIQLELSNTAQLETPGGLSNVSLPTIISDTISLCRDLGETYLWIDRLCIVQDDAGSKHKQIQRMDVIYRSAIFTIAAALNDRGGGLPGYRGRPRKLSIWSPPRKCEVEGHGIDSDSVKMLVDSSLWNTRGWTFQERVLSRRRVYITDFQVIFECSQGHASEEMTWVPQPPPKDLKKFFGQDSRIRLREQLHIRAFSPSEGSAGSWVYHRTNAVSLPEYFSVVEDYTCRQLSFGSDILNAFSGVGNALSQALQTKTVFGLPEKYLPQAMMWSCYGDATTRPETPQIPSWSWASSSTKADYFWILGGSSFRDHSIQITSLVYFHFQDPDTGFRKLTCEERWVTQEMAIQDFAQLDGIPDILEGKYKPSSVRTTQTWLECPHNPWQTISREALDPEARRAASGLPGSLVFNTTVASLRLERDTREIYERQSFRERDVKVCAHDGDTVGWLNKMSPEWIEKHVGRGKFYDFIVVCGALANWQARKILAQYVKDFNLWRLHVMLVERVSPAGPYVVRRIDVGIIEAHRWKDCNPRWETVVLC